MGKSNRKPTPVPSGNVVEEFMIGDTLVRICDDYCRDRTPEEVQQILDRIAERAIIALNRRMREENIIL